MYVENNEQANKFTNLNLNPISNLTPQQMHLFGQGSPVDPNH